MDAEIPDAEGTSFRHEAFFYSGDSEFLAGAAGFIEDAVQAEEPVLVVVSARKIDLLRGRLRGVTAGVHFADMDAVGVNPARIIPAWADFVERNAGRPVRGIGEPIWAERTADELVECQGHESLLNVAFAGANGFTLLCPYDTAVLGQDVVDEACHSHPFIWRDDAHSASTAFLGLEAMGDVLSIPLPDPPDSLLELDFQAGSLAGLRALLRREASRAGLSATGVAAVVTAVNEVASNSLRHAGGWGCLRIWPTPDTLVCQVSDSGHIDEPLVGRRRPQTGEPGGRGLWMVNQLSELVQVRSSSTGTVIRMHFRRHRGSPGG